MADKKSFLIYYQHLSLFQQLSDEQAGILIKAILEYEVNGIIPNFGQDSLLTGFFFGVFKPYLDDHRVEYEKKCKKNSANIRKRWSKGTSESENSVGIQEVSQDTNEYERIPNNTNEYERIPTNTNDTDKNRIDKNRLEKSRIEKDREDAPNPAAVPGLDINPVIDFYNQNIGCCTAYIRDCLLDTAERYGVPNTLRACQLACSRNIRNLDYIDATAKGLFTTGEFKKEAKETPKGEAYTTEFAKIAEETLRGWGHDPFEKGDEFLDGT